MTKQNVVLFVGGVGGAKLAYGLAHVLPPEHLTVIVNTGDDFWHYGLRVCPDLDTILYTLSGLVNKVNGWGLEGDTFNALSRIEGYGEKAWFRLGDQDLATHLLRTQLLRDGETLTAITRRFSLALGVRCQILPMSDDPIATVVDTVDYGEMGFQEYFVKHRWQPAVCGLRFDGADIAKVTQSVERSIQKADVILIGPSNPWLSITPILRVPGMCDLITSRNVPRVAVTPIVGGQAIKGPTAKIMRELNYDVSPYAVMQYYEDIINGFVYDERDAELNAKGIKTLQIDTVMDSEEKRINLAQDVLRWIQDWSML